MSDTPQIQETDVIKETISKALSHYKLKEETAKAWMQKAKTVVVKDEKDKDNYEIASNSLSFINGKLQLIEDTRVSLKKVHLETGRAIDKEAKRLQALLVPIKEYLHSQREIVNAPKRKRKADAEAKKRETLTLRINTLIESGLKREGDDFICQQNEALNVTLDMVQKYTDELFVTYLEMLPPKMEETVEPEPAPEVTQKEEVKEEPANPASTPAPEPTPVETALQADLREIATLATRLRSLRLNTKSKETQHITKRLNTELETLDKYLVKEYLILQNG